MKSLVIATLGILTLPACAVDTSYSQHTLDNGDGIESDATACTMTAADVAEDPPLITIDIGNRGRAVSDIFDDMKQRPDDPFVQLAAEYATMVLNIHAGATYDDEAIDTMIAADELLSSRNHRDIITDDVEDVGLSDEMRNILSRANSFAASTSPCQGAPDADQTMPSVGDRSAPEDFNSDSLDEAPTQVADR